VGCPEVEVLEAFPGCLERGDILQNRLRRGNGNYTGTSKGTRTRASIVPHRG
jgi:hypothetical protein